MFYAATGATKRFPQGGQLGARVTKTSLEALWKISDGDVERVADDGDVERVADDGDVERVADDENLKESEVVQPRRRTKDMEYLHSGPPDDSMTSHILKLRGGAEDRPRMRLLLKKGYVNQDTRHGGPTVCRATIMRMGFCSN